ncbi:F-box domain-containing protein [Pseudozyma hubeiensis]|nr:F-box domain-containing protein [Pseudozyma hubeiensis]
MSLDPDQTQPFEQERIQNLALLQSPPRSARHDDAPTDTAPGASDVLTQDADPRDKGKRRESDLGIHTVSPAVVRVTDPQLADRDWSKANGHLNAFAAQPATPAIDIARIAPELLMRIFAFLDPISLSRAAAVCRSWASIARDDATWRAAFSTYFSLEAAQAHRTASLEASATPALRRLTTSSWRHEFQQRVDLLRQWRKTRTPTVLSTPRVDLIKKISLSKQHNLLISATDTYGVASRSNPWTGKVIKGYLDAEGTANGAGNGNPNVEFSPNVTAINTSSDASHIFWGFRSGEVAMTVLSRQGTNARGAVKNLRFTPRASHSGPVTAIAIPFASDSDGAHGPGRSPERLRQAIAALGDVASTFVTAGYDGTVRMWSGHRSWPIWIASCSTKTPISNAMATATPAQTNPEPAAPICALAYDAKNGIVAAGSTNGKVFVWSNIDVAAFLRIPAEATDPDHLRNGAPTQETLEAQAHFLRLSQSILATTIELPPGASAEVAISSIHIDAAPSMAGKGTDAGLSAEACSILVHHSGARVLLRHRVFQDASLPAETTVMGAAVMDEITAVRVDFEPRLAKRDPRSSAVQSPSTSAYASPMLAAQSDAGVNSPSTLVLGPSTTYDGSGQYPERKFVAVGTRAGSLFLFDWESSGTVFDERTQREWQASSTTPRFLGSKQLLPSIGWEAHHTSITALDITPLCIFVGTSDGTIKVYDSLSGDLIRTINDRSATRRDGRMLASGELSGEEAGRWRVGQIISDGDGLVACIGHQVLAFKVENVKREVSATEKGKGRGKGRLGDSKGASQVELRRDLRESKVELEKEERERREEYGRIRKRREMEVEGLSEQEALEYALMLSRDEEAEIEREKARVKGYVPGSHASSSRKKIEVPEQVVDDPDLADALEQIALAESKAEVQHRESFYDSIPKSYRLLEDQDFGAADDLDDSLDVYHRPASATPSPSASPYLSGVGSPSNSRAWTILSQAGSNVSTPSSDRWGKMSKVRTVNVSRSARSTPGGEEGGWSLGSNLGVPEIQSPTEFPLMTGSSAGSPAGGPKEGFFRRSSSTAAQGSLGRWNKSPNLRPVASPPSAWSTSKNNNRPSLLTTSLKSSSELGDKGKSRAVAAEEELDDDVKFAIQLSLAEQRSQTEQ